jgi:hypothetical protein
MNKVYPVPSCFILDQCIVVYKKSNITSTVVLQSARGFDSLCLV